ncbi:MAG: response regulator [Acidaminococcaceae bacterium]|jgi:CitB family two-component system response regulator MalR|nr:response regulator [Acidaminococcaceae bacterium]MCI2109987.1 response regulator [Acidaminococcaceae bacterium]
MIKILVVEDDPMVGKLHEVYINQLDGFKLMHIARSSDEALNYLEEKQVDLVILDVFMPGKDGLALLKEIRIKNIDVDVIMISAASDRTRVLTALRLGVFDYIIKPFEFERFSLALNNFKQRYSMINKETETIKQTELDGSLLNRSKLITGKIPKGLEKTTLYNVWQEVVKIDGNFTTEEISNKVGISRVSIRKYLDFLKSIHVLHLELNRGCVGRPVYKYKCINKNVSLINSYIE